MDRLSYKLSSHQRMRYHLISNLTKTSMSSSIDRVSQARQQQPVQQVKRVLESRAQAVDNSQQASRPVQEAKAQASSQAEKGRYVDRRA